MATRDWIIAHDIAPGVHLLQEARQVNAYLVEGTEYAALIDTGIGLGDMRAQAEALTDRPLVVLNTHGHWDHVGGNHRFEQIGIHSAEAHALAGTDLPPASQAAMRRLLEIAGGPAEYSRRPSVATFMLEHGQVIDLGGRQLQVWHTPGHSPGSVCFLDEAHRQLFAGDTIKEGMLYLHLAGCDPATMRDSLDLLAQMAWELDLVLPGHGPTPTDGALILEIAAGVRATLAGEVRLKKGISAHGAVRVAAFDRFCLFLPADWTPAGANTPISLVKGDSDARR